MPEADEPEADAVAPQSDRPSGFSVLLVCTANQCRSPLAEFALARSIREAGLDWTVGSAGVRALPGHRPDPQVVRILSGRGDDLTEWASRRVDRDLIAVQDLILVMTQQHRADLGMLDPSVLPRTHLLLNFADQTGGLDRSRLSGDRLGPGLSAAARRASSRPAVEPLELSDPVGRSTRAFRRCADRIEEAVDDIVFGRWAGPPRSGSNHNAERRIIRLSRQSRTVSSTNDLQHRSV